MTMCRAQEASSHDVVVVLGSMVSLMFWNPAACMRLSLLGMHCLIGPAVAGLSASSGGATTKAGRQK